MFQKLTPEATGISSEAILDLIKMFDQYRFNIHSIIMTKGDKIVTECYYKPFSKDFIHRMYSVSKTFVAVAVGLAITEGIISYEDVISDYFPEFQCENDELQRECTVLDMLKMSSNIGEGMQWWGRFESRVEAYYTLKSKKIPGTLYFYDSIGSFLLGCIIEKKTGKCFLEYLKEKVLSDIGFSKESYVLKEPGGYSVGDSGVMCTARDLALFARFIMKKGEWNGKQYIDREFMENMIVKQAHNDLMGSFDLYNSRGYGYLTWITGKDSFALIGMGDQLAICDLKKDFSLVITADNQAERTGRHIIFHEVMRHFIPEISDEPLREDKEAYEKLSEYLNSRTLTCQYGEKTSPFEKSVNGVKYQCFNNSLDISGFKLTLSEKEGELELEIKGKILKLPFGILKNKSCSFSFGQRAKKDMMGIYEDGEYDCQVSGAWVEKNIFVIKAQVTDTYFGCLNVYISFKDNRATIKLVKSGQYVFDGMEGYINSVKQMR
ncbi:MAG: serine hydrolase [Ruminococcaceae bacterium]|nr:serine hydrolase [Oscillospiraceae bacterium]